MSNYQLPARIDGLLAIASQQFTNQGKVEHVKIIANSRVEIAEGATYDNWGDGRNGHQVDLCLPPMLAHFALSTTPDYGSEICDVIRRLANVPGEFIASVNLCADHTAVSPDWRKETGVLLNAPALASSSVQDLSRIWKGGAFRVFLSHRADFKVDVTKLRTELATFGMASFVAHEDIHPTKAWQTEIERALNSMNVLVTVLSAGFGDSYWTNQEIGVALGRAVPVVSLRLDEDPKGFIGHTQAVNGRGKLPSVWATELVTAFSQHPTLSSQVLESLVRAWEESASFVQTTRIMSVLETYQQVLPTFLARIKSAHTDNRQLHNCWNITERYSAFIARVEAAGDG